MSTTSYRKTLATFMSLTLTASLLFPTFAAAEQAGQPSKLSEIEKIKNLKVTSQLPQDIKLQLSKLEPQNYLPQAYSEGNKPITVIVELQTEPVKVQQTQQNPGILANGEDTIQHLQVEQAQFKYALQSELNGKVNQQFTQVFNGFAVEIKGQQVEDLLKLPGVKAIYPNQTFYSLPFQDDANVNPFMDESTKHIGAPLFWKADVTGKNIKVGVLDTGVDYNHPSLKDAYKGGYDTIDNDNDPYETKPNPAKPPRNGRNVETSHGTHVAGTILGRGNPEIPNYDKGWVRGVAPGADLYAYRVLGEYGSGTTASVIAGIEKAVEQGMDVLNLSLGSPTNFEYTADSVAANNAAIVGVPVVISNGNSGPNGYTVGSPGAAHQAISVGASTPPLKAANFHGVGTTAIHGNIATYEKFLQDNQELEVVFAGLGKTSDFTNKNVKGKLVLISRGEITFVEKALNATAAGAAAVLIHNNADGELSPSVPDPKAVPTFGITKKDGEAIKAKLAAGTTKLTYSTVTEQDLVAGFSSRGPALPGYAIKPDILAPGVAIRSSVPAFDGKYEKAYEDNNGTSMAAPHIAGVVALLQEKAEKEQKELNPDLIKSLITNNAVSVKTREGQTYDIASQGAGRVDLPRILQAEAVASVGYTTDATKDYVPDEYSTGSVSFGQVNVGAASEKQVTLKDIANKGQVYDVSVETISGSPNVTVTADQTQVNLTAGGQASFKLTLNVPTNAAKGVYEGAVILKETTSNHTLRLPYSAYVGEDYVLPSVPTVTPSKLYFSPNGDGVQDVIDVEYGVAEKVNQLAISVVDAVYNEQGTILESNGSVNKGYYEFSKWNGTVKKDNASVSLKDGFYYLVPKVDSKLLLNARSGLIVDNTAPDYTLNEPGVIKGKPTHGTISGTIDSDLLIDLLPATEPLKNIIGVEIAAINPDGSASYFKGEVYDNGDFKVDVPLKYGANALGIFVYDLAGNGLTEPQIIEFNYKPDSPAVGAISSASEVKVGDTFRVDVKVTATEAVYAANFSVLYDKKFELELSNIQQSVTLATYQQQHNPGVPLSIQSNIVDFGPNKKRLDYAVSLSNGAAKGVDNLVSLTFKAKEAGSYLFDVQNIKLLSSADKVEAVVPYAPILIKVVKPAPEKPNPGNNYSGGGYFPSAPSGTKLKAGTLTESTKDSKKNAILAVEDSVIKAQLDNKDVKQVQLDVSDVDFTKYEQVEIQLSSSIAKALIDAKKTLRVNGTTVDIQAYNETLSELADKDGIKFIISQKNAPSTSAVAGVKQAAPTLKFATNKQTWKAPLLVGLKIDAAVAKDPRKVGVYDATYSDKLTYLNAGLKPATGYLHVNVDKSGTIFTLGSYEKSFSDLAKHWAKDRIEVLAAHHLIAGKTTPNTFKPNDNVNQAEWLSLLDRLLGSTLKWNDRAKEKGAFTNLTREQVAVLLVQALKADLKSTTKKLTFKDSNKISADAQAAIAYAVEQGFIRGTDKNLFNPKALVTRAEAAAILHRVLEHLQHQHK
ncbi:S8 family serine peptidase [Paenibacillus assamensis]|uniref:S8 family serine peptidase n=1 Tax=Paenibacillus assamensis TaxID=311244 RepID=UPI00041FDD92|nr:S8 family serine peptidase [Paenibacillus assamensis]